MTTIKHLGNDLYIVSYDPPVTAGQADPSKLADLFQHREVLSWSPDTEPCLVIRERAIGDAPVQRVSMVFHAFVQLGEPTHG